MSKRLANPGRLLGPAGLCLCLLMLHASSGALQAQDADGEKPRQAKPKQVMRVEVVVGGAGARVVARPGDAADMQKPGGERNEGSDEAGVPGMTHAVFFNEDRELGARLRKAGQLQAAGNSQQAFDLYLWVLENAGDVLFRLDDNRFLSVREFCIRSITQLPSELLRRYQLGVDGEVARLMDEVGETPSPQEVESIAVQYYLSSHGPETLDLAAELYSGRGEHARAASCWHRLLQWGTCGRLPRELIETKLTLALAREGRTREAQKLLAQIRRNSPNAALVVGGRKTPLADYLDTVLRSQTRTAGLGEVSRSHWPQLGGDSGHGVQMPARFNCDVKTGELILSGYDWRVAPAGERQRLAAQSIYVGNVRMQQQTTYGPFHPVYAGGRIFIHDDGGVVAFRPNSISEDWVVGEAGSAAAVWRRNGTSGILVRSPSGGRAYTCAYAGGVVYATLQKTGNGVEVWAVSEKGKLLWRAGKDRVGLEWLGEMSQGSDPVVADGAVYFCAWSKEQWRQDCFLVSLDAADGELNWKRFICSGPQMGANRYVVRRGGMPLLSLPAAANGLVVVCSNVGGVAAVDARSGDIRWGFAYEQSAGRNYVMLMTGQRGRAYVQSSNSTPIIREGVVYVAPADSWRLYGLDLTSGECLWRTDRKEHGHIIGVAGNRVFLAGETVEGLDAATGETAWRYDGEKITSTGLGFLTHDAVYVPGERAIYRFDPDSGKLLGRLLVDREAGEYGNLLLVEDTMVQMGLRASFFGLWDRVYAELERDIRLNPSDPIPHVRLGAIYARKEDRRNAIRSYEKALSLPARPEDAADVRRREEVKKRLYALYREAAAKALEEGDTATALTLARRNRAYATGDHKRTEAVMQLVGIYEKRNDWRSVVQELQSFLDRPPKEVYSFDRDSSVLPSLYARLRIGELIEEHGRGVYARYEAQARGLYEEGLKADLERLVEVYPNSLYAQRALMRLGDLAISDGEFRQAARLLSQYLRLAGDDAEGLAQVKWKLVHCQERLGRYGAAKSLLRELARSTPDAVVGRGEDRAPLRDVVARKLKEEGYLRARSAAPVALFRVPLAIRVKLDFGGTPLVLDETDRMLVLDRVGKLRSIDGVEGKVEWSTEGTERYVSHYGISGDHLMLCGRQSVQMVDVRTGEMLWSYSVAAVRQPNNRRVVNAYITGAAFEGGHVAVNVGSQRRDIVLLDADQGGKVVWRKDLPASPIWGPLIWQDRVVVATINGVVVYEIHTGRQLIEVANERPRRPPLLLDDGKLLVQGIRSLACMDLVTGKTLWSRPHTAYYAHSQRFDGIVELEGKSYFLSYTSPQKVSCADLESGREVWSKTVGGNRERVAGVRVDEGKAYLLVARTAALERSMCMIQLDLKTGREQWTSAQMKGAYPRDWRMAKERMAVLADIWETRNAGGRVLMSVSDPTLFCLDKETGQVVQTLTLTPDEKSPSRSRPFRIEATDEMLWVAYHDRLIGLKHADRPLPSR